MRAAAVGVFAIAALALYPPGTVADTGMEWQAEPLELATGEAFQGVWRMNDSDFRYVDAPSVALDDDGIASIVWVDQEADEIPGRGIRESFLVGRDVDDVPVTMDRQRRKSS
ncbi:hypothetical protein HC341_04570 [Aquisalimonas sp. 2447]|uniref:hypothetical protein n=1 Tax=Aquisalimonas sp. 2447 TaxID=2740807 RepID=UPI00143230A4|nr:hypothetical protein [Aquisalimonas sp. 2447]QIT54555.1 hypothetical protein HC341_04570 [Aquisalimonas sp. 2447]